jgi:hypothetical protein
MLKARQFLDCRAFFICLRRAGSPVDLRAEKKRKMLHLEIAGRKSTALRQGRTIALAQKANGPSYPFVRN